ncbi:hypothetical protein ABFS82_05G100800 [Erythranthe guttata]|uniref:uncharacterized protein LOC105956929 isoform X3 n=1 Tax=Erythranthe guttata TaxID=4155 RepID=UPI00064E0DBB|nr:PREDICTED: uncharacterized protein LOC105956929 isoform X3 [Erythranthe guttata]|eukprot:XP_012836297.1 PREDICTED: uncharacterized protein LOC105956929 isoform X3 [Erythranthe guttata]
MVDGKSPEWLPPGFSEKFKYKDGKKIKYYQNAATGVKYHSKKDVLNCAKSENTLSTPQTTNQDENGISSNNKVDAILATTNGSAEGLPNGWKIEERRRKSSSGSYKVYTDLSTGNKYYSKAAVSRYLSSVDQNKLDDVDETVTNISPKQPVSTTNVGPTPENKDISPKPVSATNVGPTSDNKDISPEPLSMTNVGPASEKKRKGSAYKTVACETVAADDLPPGWIKEIVTSKFGNKIRKDPYYTDPVSGYVFRSKLDVERYLTTNNINSCACRPKKKDEFDDRKFIENEIPSSNPANGNPPEHKTGLVLGGELNGEEGSASVKTRAESDAKISKGTQVGEEDSTTTKNRAESDAKISKETQENEVTTVNEPKKLKKRRNFSSPPSRTSKRLAKCKPESNSVPSERSGRSSTSEIPILPLEPSADVVEANEPKVEALKGAETRQEIKPMNAVVNERAPPKEVPAIIQEEQIIIGEGANNKSQESQLLYDFGDSWSDPLEFALKTLRGDIPIEDTLAFAGGFGFQNNVNFNTTTNNNNQANGGVRSSSQSDAAPVFFQDEFAPRSESSSKQNGAAAADQLPGNSNSFFAQGNVVKRDWPAKFNP